MGKTLINEPTPQGVVDLVTQINSKLVTLHDEITVLANRLVPVLLAEDSCVPNEIGPGMAKAPLVNDLEFVLERVCDRIDQVVALTQRIQL
jgi:hypothetical protein